MNSFLIIVSIYSIVYKSRMLVPKKDRLTVYKYLFNGEIFFFFCVFFVVFFFLSVFTFEKKHIF